MYVSDLDRPWLETPFLFQGFEIHSQQEIDDLKRYCKFVMIDVHKSINVTPNRRPPSTSITKPVQQKSNAPGSKHAAQKLEFEMLKMGHANPTAARIYQDRTIVEEEIEVVREVYQKTKELIYYTLEDFRLGKSIDSAHVKAVVGKLAESVIRNPDALIHFSQLKKKDEYTALHSLRVCVLALAFGRHLGFDEEALNIIGIGALLHDMGKMNIPKDILNKPGKLNEKEFEIIKSHVPKGVDILEKSNGIPLAAIEIARSHHERYNGSGYIMGLKGDQIGQFGMIGAIVDCYDAITSDRIYHTGMSSHSALTKMYEWRQRDFHPTLVEQFIQCMGIYPIGSLVELNTGEVGVVVTMNKVRRLKPQVLLVLQANNLPYDDLMTIDLMKKKTNDGRPYEIDSVLDPGTYGIDPITYLPVVNI